MRQDEIPSESEDRAAAIAFLERYEEQGKQSGQAGIMPATEPGSGVPLSPPAKPRVLGFSFRPGPEDILPKLIIQTLILPESKDAEGVLIRDVTIAWWEIIKLILQDPNLMYQIPHRTWEEVIAGGYEAAGYKVTLTPASGDLGRDVIAYRDGFGSVRFIESVKRYTPNHPVTANDVRALLGVLHSDQNATKGIVSTTWEFAPKIAEDPLIKPHIPYRLELVNRHGLIERFKDWTCGPKHNS
jgi:restriction system protein